MSYAVVEALKLDAERLSKKREDRTVTLGKLVDEMFVSATTYLEDYAQRTGDEDPWRMWLAFQESWRKNVMDSVSIAQTMNNTYQRYKTLFEEVKNVATEEELASAILRLKDLLEIVTPVLPVDSARGYLIVAQDVADFEFASQFPEMNRHYAFIIGSLQQFTETWEDLHKKSMELRLELEMAIHATIPPLFRRWIKKAMEIVVPLFEGVERFVASLDLEE